MTKEAKTYSGEKIISFLYDAGKSGQLKIKKIRLGHFLAVVQCPSGLWRFLMQWAGAGKPPYAAPSPRGFLSSYSLHWWCNPRNSFLWQTSPSVFGISHDRGLFNELVLCISFSNSSSKEYSKLISRNLQVWSCYPCDSKSFLQHHISKALMAQLSQLYVSNRKRIDSAALVIWTFADRVMSVFLHTIQVCHNFPVKKRVLLMSWLKSPGTLESKKRKSVTVSLMPLLLPWHLGTGYCDMSFHNIEPAACFCTLLFFPYQGVL